MHLQNLTVRVFLDEQRQCFAKQCSNCVPWCNEKMDNDVWYLQLDLQTSGLNIDLPDKIREVTPACSVLPTLNCNNPSMLGGRECPADQQRYHAQRGLLGPDVQHQSHR